MMKRIALICVIVTAYALLFAGNTRGAVSAAADSNSIYGDWVCIVETEDAEAFVFLLSLTEPGGVTFAAGWVQSEMAGLYTGRFTITEDVLNLEMTDNESSDTLIGTYAFDISKDILLLTNQSGDSLSYLFEAGESVVFSALGDAVDEAVLKGSYVYKIAEHTEEGEISDPAGLPQEGIPLLEYLNDPILIAFAENFQEDFPVSVSVRHDGEASGTPVTATDSETIRAVFEALVNITVWGEWPVGGHTDDYLNYYFEMFGGRMIYGFEFQNGMLLDSRMGLHEITGFDTLQRALPDPGAW